MKNALLAARGLLMHVTPLKADCGSLCGRACCQGDEQTGMLLFPGEESLYAQAPFARVVPARFSLAGKPARLLVCRGTCDRADRPLACRLFPLFLRIDQDKAAHERTRVVMDPRARSVCPLCDYGLEALDPAFREAVRKAYDLLLSDAACHDFLTALCEALTL